MLRFATEFIVLAGLIALAYFTMIFSCASIDRCFL
jgi:hypothetical protein